MPTNTYTPLATVTLGGSDAEITFGSIPSTYKDLIVTIHGSATSAGSPSLRFNNDSAENYHIIRLYENGSSSFQQAFSATYLSVGIMQNAQALVMAQIYNYSSSNTHKTAIGRGGSVGQTTRTELGRWANTTAITSVSVLFDGGQSYNTGTVISLYGVL